MKKLVIFTFFLILPSIMFPHGLKKTNVQSEYISLMKENVTSSMQQHSATLFTYRDKNGTYIRFLEKKENRILALSSVFCSNEVPIYDPLNNISNREDKGNPKINARFPSLPVINEVNNNLYYFHISNEQVVVRTDNLNFQLIRNYHLMNKIDFEIEVFINRNTGKIISIKLV